MPTKTSDYLWYRDFDGVEVILEPDATHTFCKNVILEPNMLSLLFLG